jgi:hypothetical protein
MRAAAAALALLVLTVHGAAADDTPGEPTASTTTLPATPPQKPRKVDPEIGKCVKRVRGDQQTCVRAATERCRTTFETSLPDCYGSNAECARGCIAEQTKCRDQPSLDQDGCKLACGSDQKVENQKCKVEPDIKQCQTTAKVKALKCKQKCAVDAAPALQACLRTFDDCLVACNKGRKAAAPE